MAGRCINKVTLLGHVGSEPETRYTQNSTMVVNLRMATSESWLDPETKERKERTEWHRIVFFGRLAEIASQYVRKGSHLYLEGRLQTRKWQDQRTGQDRWSTEIVGSEMVMLDSKSDNQLGRDSNERRDSGGYGSQNSRSENQYGRDSGERRESGGYDSPESNDTGSQSDSFGNTADDPIQDVPW